MTKKIFDIDDVSIAWLDNLIKNSLNAVKRDPSKAVLQTSYDQLQAWANALDTYEVIPDVKVASTTIKEKDKQKEVVSSFLECSDHTKYGGKNRPRTNCATCWDIFKKLQGYEKYELALRKFNRRSI